MPPKARKSTVTLPSSTANRPLSTTISTPPPQPSPSPPPAADRPRSPDNTSMGGGMNRTESTANPRMGGGLETFQAFSHRRIEMSAGSRMARIRKQKGVTISAVVAAARLGVGSQYEAVESGTSGIERWAAVLGKFAVNLEVPVQELFPASIVAPGLSSSLVGVTLGDASVEVAAEPNSVSSSTGLGFSGSGSGAGACGTRLLQVRSEKGMSADFVCSHTGISLSEYRQIERGESASGYEKWVWVLARFCRLLNISPFLLVAGLPLEEGVEGSDNEAASSSFSSDLIMSL
eukprot:GILI01026773.1.p1 GENE.GILI01026773.1~~GILI01026773.1.p1  ORF type:complete len:306 (+),score=41.99 GILI01026773.1:49-918(+)